MTHERDAAAIAKLQGECERCGIRHRVLLMNREEADQIKAAHPLVDISLNDETTRLRFRRPGEQAQ